MSGYPQAIHAIPVRTRPGVEVRAPASLLLPSFGVVVFAVTLLEVLFLSHGAQGLFRDSDTGWHVRNGEAILQTLALPRADYFSFTREGAEWFAWEWLADIVFGAAHQLAGLPAVALISAAAIAFMAWGMTRLSLWLGANLFFTAGAVVVLLGTTSIHWLARPHVFSWLFGLAFLAVAEQERQGGSRAIFALPILACVWANVHGSFLLGPVMLFIYGLGEWISNPRSLFVRYAMARFGLTAIVSLLASFINPYGWRLHAHVLAYLQNDYLMDRISEFRSFSFHSPGAYYVELFLLISVAGIVALLRQRAYGPAILGIAMIHASLYSARHIPTAAVLLLPLAAAALTREAGRIRGLASFLDYSDRLRAMDRRVWGIVPLAIVVIATAGGLKALAGTGAVDFDPKVFPVQAANFLERSNLTARTFSKDHWGGYLIYRFEGRAKVFIDGRSDFYGQQFLESYAQIADVKPAWSDVLKQYDVGLVLIPPDHALASVLQLSAEWKRVYADSVASIFERVV